MSDVGYIEVVNFEKFQHYKQRNPPWIKLHAILLDNYEYARLQDASKAHLVGLWILASKHGNRIPADPQWIAQRIGATDAIDLEHLITAGFIRRLGDASIALATRKQNHVPETEAETEAEKNSVATLPAAGRSEEPAEVTPLRPTPPDEPDLPHGEFMAAMRKVCSGRKEQVTETDMTQIGSIAKRFLDRGWRRADVYRATVGWRAKIDRGEVSHIPAGSKFTLAKLYDKDPTVDPVQVGLDAYQADTEAKPPPGEKRGQMAAVGEMDFLERFAKGQPRREPQRGAA